MLSGAELVLCALVPKAGARWQQVHINRTIAEQFLLLKVGEDRIATFERVDKHEASRSQLWILTANEP